MKRELELAKVFDTLANGCREGKMPTATMLRAVDMVRDGLVLMIAKDAGLPQELLVFAWDELHGRLGEIEECPVHGSEPCPDDEEEEPKQPKGTRPRAKGKK